jgi:hypothetical protein
VALPLGDRQQDPPQDDERHDQHSRIAGRVIDPKSRRSKDSADRRSHQKRNPAQRCKRLQEGKCAAREWSQGRAKNPANRCLAASRQTSNALATSTATLIGWGAGADRMRSRLGVQTADPDNVRPSGQFRAGTSLQN